MKYTPEQYAQLLAKHPNLAPTKTPLNSPGNSGVCPPKQKLPKRLPLERVTPRKDPCGARFEIIFYIYSQRPLDWDNYWTKCIQDALVNSGVLYDDAWDVLQGRVISCKANSKEEERTVITITQI